MQPSSTELTEQSVQQFSSVGSDSSEAPPFVRSLGIDARRKTGNESDSVLASVNASTFSLPIGSPVVRFPEQLRIHPALEQLGLTNLVGEIEEAAGSKEQPEPILITTDGIILAGFGGWRRALLEGWQEVSCIEYPIGEQDAIQFILSHCKPRRGWNPFIRIQLALTLEPALQRRALENMRAGGRYKGSANLAKAQHLDVRQQIAQAAGVGVRNASKVKTILKTAHPRVIAALREGTLTINAAMQFCKLPKSEQLESLVLRTEERLTNKVIRQCIPRPKEQTITADAATIR